MPQFCFKILVSSPNREIRSDPKLDPEPDPKFSEKSDADQFRFGTAHGSTTKRSREILITWVFITYGR